MSENLTITITGPRAGGKTALSEMLTSFLRGAGISHTFSVINGEGTKGTVSKTPSTRDISHPVLRGKTVDIVEDSSPKPEMVDTSTTEYKFAVAHALVAGTDIGATIEQIVSTDDSWCRSSTLLFRDMPADHQVIATSLMRELYLQIVKNAHAYMESVRNELVNSANTRKVALDTASKLPIHSPRELIVAAKEIQDYLNNL